jgi:hypothetical protein
MIPAVKSKAIGTRGACQMLGKLGASGVGRCSSGPALADDPIAMSDLPKSFQVANGNQCGHAKNKMQERNDPALSERCGQDALIHHSPDNYSFISVKSC